MSVKDILQFILLELQKAIDDNSIERIHELCSAIDVLYEVAKSNKDKLALNILDKMNYIVFHYDEDFSFVADYLSDAQKMISKL